MGVSWLVSCSRIFLPNQDTPFSMPIHNIRTYLRVFCGQSLLFRDLHQKQSALLRIQGRRFKGCRHHFAEAFEALLLEFDVAVAALQPGYRFRMRRESCRPGSNWARSEPKMIGEAKAVKQDIAVGPGFAPPFGTRTYRMQRGPLRDRGHPLLQCDDRRAALHQLRPEVDLERVGALEHSTGALMT